MAIAGTVAMVTAAINGPGHSAAAASTNSTGWEVVPVPTLRGQVDLTGVVALGPTDAWAVGYVTDANRTRTLTLHWDGTRWSRVVSPNRGSSNSRLFAVAGTSSSDVWAIGYDQDRERTHRTLVMHWDGKRWAIVASPNVDSLGSRLMGVAAVAPNDVWAVGSATKEWPLLSQTLVEHWDGRSWSIVDSPDPSVIGAGSNLLDIAASSEDVVAVGNADQGDWVLQPLIERWNGDTWSVDESPAMPESALLGGVAAGVDGSAWAVGWRQEDSQYRPLAVRQNGSRWDVVRNEAFSGLDGAFSSVAVVNSSDVWAVGTSDHQEPPYARNLAAHWDGTSWTVAPVSSPGSIGNGLTGVAAVPGTRCVVAVGQSTSDTDLGQALIVRHCADGS